MPTPLWSHRLSGSVAGVALARESGQTLVWDVNHWLVVLSRRGSVQGQAHQERPMTAAALADDGSAFALADDQSIAWLRRDLSARWTKAMANRPTAVALDSLGRCVAVADAGSRLHLFDKGGRDFGGPLKTPRPLFHLHFLASQPFLIGAADFGLVLGLDLRTRQWAWQDSPVIHLGDLAAAGDGQTIAVACFSEGIRRYDLAGKAATPIATPEPARFAAASFDGRRFLTGSIFSQVCGFDDTGGQRFDQRFESPLAGVGLAPLGDTGVVGLADGRVVGIDLTVELK